MVNGPTFTTALDTKQGEASTPPGTTPVLGGLAPVPEESLDLISDLRKQLAGLKIDLDHIKKTTESSVASNDRSPIDPVVFFQ